MTPESEETRAVSEAKTNADTEAAPDFDAFKEAVEADGFDLDDPADAVTLAAYVVGPNVTRIAQFLGRPRSWCADAGANLRANAIWRKDRIETETGEAPDTVELCIQILVAKGFLETEFAGCRA